MPRCLLSFASFAVPGSVLLVLISGCSNEGPAREEFGRAHSCPLERVEIKKRSDVRWSTVAWSGPGDVPPPEVQADPARLAKWKDDQEKTHAPLVKALDEHDVFEAHGCGHDSFVGCKRPAKSNGPNRVSCEVVAMKK
jgi:hypothetical protein